MSIRYILQNNLKGHWADWGYNESRENAINLCKQMNEQRPKDVNDICSWRVIKYETVKIYP